MQELIFCEYLHLSKLSRNRKLHHFSYRIRVYVSSHDCPYSLVLLNCFIQKYFIDHSKNNNKILTIRLLKACLSVTSQVRLKSKYVHDRLSNVMSNTLVNK